MKELSKLEGLLPFADDAAFRTTWAAIKQRNKERLAHYVQTTLGLTIRTDAMYDVQIKVRLLYIHIFSCTEYLMSFSVFTNTRYDLQTSCLSYSELWPGFYSVRP